MDYVLSPQQPLGATVTSIDLKDLQSYAAYPKIQEDLAIHKVLIFKNQGVLSPERQLAITRWFGDIETAGFVQHPKCPSRELLRVANDDSEGFTGFGDAGFHIDCSFLKNPNSVSIYHIINNPTEGATC